MRVHDHVVHQLGEAELGGVDDVVVDTPLGQPLAQEPAGERRPSAGRRRARARRGGPAAPSAGPAAGGAGAERVGADPAYRLGRTPRGGVEHVQLGLAELLVGVEEEHQPAHRRPEPGQRHGGHGAGAVLALLGDDAGEPGLELVEAADDRLAGAGDAVRGTSSYASMWHHSTVAVVEAVGRDEPQPAAGALGQREADPADAGESDEVGEDAAGHGVDVAGVVEHELQAVDVVGLGPGVPALASPVTTPPSPTSPNFRSSLPDGGKMSVSVDSPPSAASVAPRSRQRMGQNVPVSHDGEAGGAEGESGRSGPPCSCWRSASPSAWWPGATSSRPRSTSAPPRAAATRTPGCSSAFASLGAVACLFVGLMLVARILRRLGITKPASSTPPPKTVTDRPRSSRPGRSAGTAAERELAVSAEPAHELQPGPGLVDRGDLDVDEAELEAEVAYDVLVEVGRAACSPSSASRPTPCRR